MPISENSLSSTDVMIMHRLAECARRDRETQSHTQQIRDIQNCIMRDEGIMRREIQALSMRLARLEERLGITEPVVVPGD
jgi:hypothetical protein